MDRVRRGLVVAVVVLVVVVAGLLGGMQAPPAPACAVPVCADAVYPEHAAVPVGRLP